MHVLFARAGSCPKHVTLYGIVCTSGDVDMTNDTLEIVRQHAPTMCTLDVGFHPQPDAILAKLDLVECLSQSMPMLETLLLPQYFPPGNQTFDLPFIPQLSALQTWNNACRIPLPTMQQLRHLIARSHPTLLDELTTNRILEFASLSLFLYRGSRHGIVAQGDLMRADNLTALTFACTGNDGGTFNLLHAPNLQRLMIDSY